MYFVLEYKNVGTKILLFIALNPKMEIIIYVIKKGVFVMLPNSVLSILMYLFILNVHENRILSHYNFYCR